MNQLIASPHRAEVVRTAPVRRPADTCRSLKARGFRSDEAWNLTAVVQGLRPVDGGWAIAEIERLLFIEYLVATGRIRS